MLTTRSRRITVKNCMLQSLPDSDRLVIVVGPEPTCAESIAASFARQGETMRVLWFEQARQALAAGVRRALAGVIVCHRSDASPDGELSVLRSALPDTPVLPWQLGV